MHHVRLAFIPYTIFSCLQLFIFTQRISGCIEKSLTSVPLCIKCIILCSRCLIHVIHGRQLISNNTVIHCHAEGLKWEKAWPAKHISTIISIFLREQPHALWVIQVGKFALRSLRAQAPTVTICHAVGLVLCIQLMILVRLDLTLDDSYLLIYVSYLTHSWFYL